MKESLLAVVKVINTTHETTKDVANTQTNSSASGSFFVSTSMPPVELIFRGLRVAAVFFGLLFILTLLRGAFKYMVSSGRDETVSLCRGMILTGGIGVLVMFFLYIFASTQLLKL